MLNFPFHGTTTNELPRSGEFFANRLIQPIARPEVLKSIHDDVACVFPAHNARYCSSVSAGYTETSHDPSVCDTSTMVGSALADIGHQFEPTGFHFVPRHFEPSPGTNLFMRCAIVAAVDRGFKSVETVALQDRVNLRELQTIRVGGKLVEFHVDLIAHLRFHLGGDQRSH